MATRRQANDAFQRRMDVLEAQDPVAFEIAYELSQDFLRAYIKGRRDITGRGKEAFDRASPALQKRIIPLYQEMLREATKASTSARPEPRRAGPSPRRGKAGRRGKKR